MEEKVSCIIPAYNEGKRVSKVIGIAKNHPLIDELIVINDGSSDDTKEVIKKFKGIKIISYQKNRGKSFAVMKGLEKARHSLIILLDADLGGLTVKNISDLILPVKNKVVDVTISLRKNSPLLWRLIKMDSLSGERVFSKELINKELLAGKDSFEVETIINKQILKNKLKVGVVPWMNVRSPWKYEKMGSIVKGVKKDIIMTNQVINAAGGIIKFTRQIYTLIMRRKVIRN